MEEGRRWREGGIREFLRKNRGGFFFIEKNGSEEIFMEEQRGKEKILGDLLRQICTLRKGGCYPFSWYVGSGARKPIGFLGPANLLVGRVENQSWQ